MGDDLVFDVVGVCDVGLCIVWINCCGDFWLVEFGELFELDLLDMVVFVDWFEV